MNALNAGTYSVIFSLLDGFKWEDDGTLGDRIIAWSIDKAVVDKLPSQKNTIIYDGTAKTPEWSDYDSDKLTIGGIVRSSAAGTYKATFTPTNNCIWADGSNSAKEVEWRIKSSEIDIIDSRALPTASDTKKGAVIIGNGIEIDGDTISVPLASSVNNGLMTANDKKKLDELNASSYIPRSTPTTFSISTDAWTGDPTEISDFVYYADIDVIGLTENDYAEVIFDRKCQSTLIDANICSSGNSLANKIRIYSENVPSETVSGQYIIMKGAV